MGVRRAARTAPVPLCDSMRREMAGMCTSTKTRTEAFTTDRPTEWRPWEAIDPVSGASCTPSGAWRMVEQYLRGNGTIRAMLLRQPPGRTGYTFHMPDGAGNRI